MAATPPDASSNDLAPNGWPRHILSGFRAGDRAALTWVYRNHARAVAKLLRHGFAFQSDGDRRRFVGYGSSFELQDMLHETFRRAFEPRARDGYDGIRPYEPYLLTIARNLVLRSFRAREVAFPPEALAREQASGSVPSAPSIGPEVGVEREQIRALVTAYLDTLPPRDRELVRLRFHEGLSQREAAERLDMGRQRLRTREAKIRAGLLRYLDERGEAHLAVGTWPLVFGLLTEALR